MISEEFRKGYKKLNTEQKKAVDTIEGPVLVVAGPGTGKTTILTLRIANILLKTDTPSSGILALTFSEAGAKTMRIKLRQIIGYRADEIAIHTFHGFAASVIREFTDHFPHLSYSKQITETEAESFIREILKTKKFTPLRPLGEPDFYVQKIISAIKDAKQEAWSPAIMREFAVAEIARIQNNSTSISTRGASKGQMKGEALKRIEKCERTILFADVYQDYEERKREERKMDFDDLIFETLRTLQTDKLLLQLLQEKFLYILVDEHQDTNDSQNLIIKLIADFFESPNLFVVGDDKQAIYRFQGASVENFLSLERKWPNTKIISLGENYRSHQSILDASFKMIELNYEIGQYQHLRTKLKSNKAEARPIEIVVAPDRETEEEYLIQNLRQILRKNPEAHVAVIVRKNRDVAKLLSLCETHQIEASAERGVDIFAHPVGVLFFALLEFLHDPAQTESLASTIAGGLWKLDFQARVSLIKNIRSGNLEEIENQIPQLKELQRRMADSGSTAYLILAAELSGLLAIVGSDPLKTEIWRSLWRLATSLATENNLEDPRQLMGVMLGYKKSADHRLVKIVSGKIDARASIMTAHGSKGLEFDHVFLPFATEESWLNKHRGAFFVFPREKEADDNIRDERRLFYVGLTRAKAHAVISFSLQDSVSKLQTPLRFIDELDEGHIAKSQIPKTKSGPVAEDTKQRKARQKNEEMEYTKRILLENGLSVTALNHFVNCPNEFFYKSILRLPEPPNASSEKGNAMHEALAKVWREKNKSIKDIAHTLTNSVTTYFSHSLLPKFEKEAILEELLTNAPKVALALADHFAQPGKISTETWVETNFEHPFEKERINLRLHGKLDALVEKENEILVYDYKTTEAKSVNAIKGETASSDGNYFRQLVFYKILLEGPSTSPSVNKDIEPALVFVKPDSKGRCPTIALPIKKSDTERVKSEIISLLESVWSGSFLTTSCPDPTCQFCAYRKLLK